VPLIVLGVGFQDRLFLAAEDGEQKKELKGGMRMIRITWAEMAKVSDVHGRTSSGMGWDIRCPGEKLF